MWWFISFESMIHLWLKWLFTHITNGNSWPNWFWFFARIKLSALSTCTYEQEQKKCDFIFIFMSVRLRFAPWCCDLRPPKQIYTIYTFLRCDLMSSEPQTIQPINYIKLIYCPKDIIDCMWNVKAQDIRIKCLDKIKYLNLELIYMIV